MKGSASWKFWIVVVSCGTAGMATAKLPAPPPVDPAKAAEAKQKAADAAKKAADQLAQAQDRVVAHYKKQKGMAMPAAKPAETAKPMATGAPAAKK